MSGAINSKSSAFLWQGVVRKQRTQCPDPQAGGDGPGGNVCTPPPRLPLLPLRLRPLRLLKLLLMLNAALRHCPEAVRQQVLASSAAYNNIRMCKYE